MESFYEVITVKVFEFKRHFAADVVLLSQRLQLIAECILVKQRFRPADVTELSEGRDDALILKTVEVIQKISAYNFTAIERQFRADPVKQFIWIDVRRVLVTTRVVLTVLSAALLITDRQRESRDVRITTPAGSALSSDPRINGFQIYRDTFGAV